MSVCVDNMTTANGWNVLTVPIVISHTKNIVVRKKDSNVSVIFYTMTRLCGVHTYDLEEKCGEPFRDTTSVDGWKSLHSPIWLDDTTCLILKYKEGAVCGLFYKFGVLVSMFFQDV